MFINLKTLSNSLFQIDYVCSVQVKQVWKEAPIEGGMLDYLKFVHIIKRGKDDE